MLSFIFAAFVLTWILVGVAISGAFEASSVVSQWPERAAQGATIMLRAVRRTRALTAVTAPANRRIKTNLTPRDKHAFNAAQKTKFTHKLSPFMKAAVFSDYRNKPNKNAHKTSSYVQWVSRHDCTYIAAYLRSVGYGM